MAEYNEACCSVPPVSLSSVDYESKGSTIEIAGLKTYVTGLKTATKAILVIHDIFGFKQQTIQGADLLSSPSPQLHYQVFMPDFFDGEPAETAWYPPTDDEKKAKLNGFIRNKADTYKKMVLVPDFIREANKMMDAEKDGGGGFHAWAVVGFCWGGHMATLLAGRYSLFSAAVSCHPGMIKDEDAEQVTIPFAVLASKDESADEVASFVDRLKVPKYVDFLDTDSWLDVCTRRSSKS